MKRFFSLLVCSMTLLAQAQTEAGIVDPPAHDVQRIRPGMLGRSRHRRPLHHDHHRRAGRGHAQAVEALDGVGEPVPLEHHHADAERGGHDGRARVGAGAIGVRRATSRAKGTSWATTQAATRTSGTATPAFLPDGSLIYDSVESSKMRIYFYWDLFRRKPGEWGQETEQGERLSFGLRANEPTVSPDGTQVASAR